MAKPSDLPVGRHPAVAVLVVGVSETGLASGPTGLHGSDSTLAAGIATSTSAILAEAQRRNPAVTDRDP